jgi:GH15 family glucan-1,4-alpha-glucosidase
LVRIEDYAIIGDTQTSTLVGIDGSIDWLCLPRFDSGACFAALLGDPSHGRWKIAPAGALRRTARSYRGDTLILETQMETEDGVVRVVDCMPIRAKNPDVVRVVEGISGNVAMRSELVVRFDYGSVVPWVRKIDGRLHAVAGPDALILSTPVPTRGEGFTTRFTCWQQRCALGSLLASLKSHAPYSAAAACTIAGS